MAGDVAHKINGSATGKEGVAVVNTNGFKIMPTAAARQLDPSVELNAMTDVQLSGALVDRFDDYKYYTT